MTKYFTTVLLFIVITSQNFSQNSDTLDRQYFVKRSTVMSAIFPGLGQIHNNKIKPNNIHSHLWWKMPIIYGGLTAATYFFIQNISEHKIVRNERLSRNDGNPAIDYVDYSNDDLQVIQNIYRKRRDLSFIGILGIYTLQLIDANVEAHLFLFDSSDNLSLNISFNRSLISNKRITPLLTMNYQLGKEKTGKRRFYN
tara:strand:+ start:1391 stop:1981 length:591 start_codon:yes stop_codon:yes gene_type:complete